LEFVCDTVDSIIGPVFVVPDTLKRASYYEANPKDRNNVTFTTVPMEFLFRDNYSKINYSDNLYGFINEYDRASNSTTKKKILASLIIKSGDILEEDDEDDEIDLINLAL
jgi:hypothetical protein